MVSPYELFSVVQKNGYVPPTAAQIILDSLTTSTHNTAGAHTAKFMGTGDGLKSIMENDRVNVFKCFYEGQSETESTWLAGEESGKGMMLPKWAERLIHADVLVMQEKIETTMDYLLHVIEREKPTQL